MARQASKDSVAADMRPVNYRGAVNRMKLIKSKSDKQKAIAGEIGDIYAKCEGIEGVNKAACKIFNGLAKLEPEDRLLVFRDLNGLLDAAGFSEEGADLVDKAQGSVVPFRMPTGDAEEGAVGNDVPAEIEEFSGDAENDGHSDEINDFAVGSEDVDGFTEMSEEELAAQKPRADAAEAKKVTGRGKKAFGEGPAPEPYTGDNSDLAGD